ncbi:hypothetical protein V2G26_020411 [Clonostachys chloroleuca]
MRSPLNLIAVNSKCRLQPVSRSPTAAHLMAQICPERQVNRPHDVAWWVARVWANKKHILTLALLMCQVIENPAFYEVPKPPPPPLSLPFW